MRTHFHFHRPTDPGTNFWPALLALLGALAFLGAVGAGALMLESKQPNSVSLDVVARDRPPASPIAARRDPPRPASGAAATPRGLCPAGVANDCGEASSAWCDPTDRLLACCASDLVATGVDGVCECPPGGPSLLDGASGCPVPPDAGSVDAVADAAEVVARLRPRLRACYNEGIRQNESLAGKMTLTASIGPDGQVFRARVKEGRMASARVQTCALDALRTARFAPPRGGRGSFDLPVTFVQAEAGASHPADAASRR